MPSRAEDWYNQAAKDLDTAERMEELGRHEWSCFAAQQAAEKAVKALHLRLGQDAWGHVVAELLEELPKEVEAPSSVVESGRVLDNYYIPTRYPNSHPKGAPFEHYGPFQSADALKHARIVIAFSAEKGGF
ncbi:MAG: HEPN domain-containing protein [Rhodothermales bacterium]